MPFFLSEVLFFLRFLMIYVLAVLWGPAWIQSVLLDCRPALNQFIESGLSWTFGNGAIVSDQADDAIADVEVTNNNLKLVLGDCFANQFTFFGQLLSCIAGIALHRSFQVVLFVETVSDGPHKPFQQWG